ncbi:TIGR03435 family protein [Hymenobacter crusticola]|uniref:Thioredoxin domain-containing protein n=1 Tax=Hymenobacter crusticola TaxID=1770526 RepID=A0A243W9C9_9BACT|nr:TIGR03435 family protein [Hymenobacter crusticola]OUJ71815.1 hypothetical protein BXP70_20915 [Hymenobacter crusticola]
MSKILLAAFLLFFSQLHNVRAAAPKIGEAAPQLKLTGLLQTAGKMDQSIQSLQGKVLVLEFWATWCAPCVAAMPHLNSLSEKYKSRGVQFISITDQEATKAKLFLKKRAITGWVGLDTDRTMYKAYEVTTIPFTVIIGADGLVAGYSEGSKLSEAMLEQVLAGKKLSAPSVLSDKVAASPANPEATKPIYELSIRPSTGKETLIITSTTFYKTTGASALDVLKVAFDATLKPIEITAPLPEGRFDVVATNPTKDSPEWAWRAQLQQMLQDVWGIMVQPENKEVEVYELTVSPAAEQRLRKADANERASHQSSEDRTLAGSNVSVDVLAKTLQDVLATPVVNATNLSGNYDYNFDYDNSKPEVLLKSVEQEMGLNLRRTKRLTNFMVIRSKSAAAL